MPLPARDLTDVHDGGQLGGSSPVPIQPITGREDAGRLTTLLDDLGFVPRPDEADRLEPFAEPGACLAHLRRI